MERRHHTSLVHQHAFVAIFFLVLNSVVPHIAKADNEIHVIQWGLQGDYPIVSDFTGDGREDLAVWRPSFGDWHIRRTGDGQQQTVQWGILGDVPIAADYDGDGRADQMVWRPSDVHFYLKPSSGSCPPHFSPIGGGCRAQWGLSGDMPTTGDFDGDGRADLVVWRPSDGTFYFRLSSGGACQSPMTSHFGGCKQQWGVAGDIVLPRDFDGDGTTDLAIWRPSDQYYYVMFSGGACLPEFGNWGLGCRRQWGLSGDKPIPADFDGDGRTDLAVYRPVYGTWYVKLSSTMEEWVRPFGLPSLEPIPVLLGTMGRANKAVWDPISATWVISTYDLPVCDVLDIYDGLAADTSGILNTCLNSPIANTVEIPRGVYWIGNQVQINQPGTILKTLGTSLNDPRCTGGIPGTYCATLVAMPSFSNPGGIVRMFSDGSTIDHIHLIGNNFGRWQTSSGRQCANGQNDYGKNFVMKCNDCSLQNSASTYTLCGAAVELQCLGCAHNTDENVDVTIHNNLIARNGIHTRQGLWSDGITVHYATNLRITNNEVQDSTDIDIIVGRCVDCDIRQNRITHSAPEEHGSFAALMMAPVTVPAVQVGTEVTQNVIDCGPSKRCGFGFYIGIDSWNNQPIGAGAVWGGSYFLNTIQNAQQGLNVDDAHTISLYNNPVSQNGSSTRATCGNRATTSYNIGMTSHTIDTSRETLGTTYSRQSWDQCIPNWGL